MKKNRRDILRFTVVFEKATEGGYVVTVPALPGCVTQGETFEEAEEMARDAIAGYLESLVKLGQPFPTTSTGIVETIEVAAPPGA